MLNLLGMLTAANMSASENAKRTYKPRGGSRPTSGGFVKQRESDAAYKAILEGQVFSTPEIAAKRGVESNAARVQLTKMEARGLVKKVGKGKNGHNPPWLWTWCESTGA